MKAASERNKPTEKNNRVGRGKINNMWSCGSQSESANKSSSSKASVSEGVLFSTKPSFVHTILLVIPFACNFLHAGSLLFAARLFCARCNPCSVTPHLFFYFLCIFYEGPPLEKISNKKNTTAWAGEK